MDLTLKQVETLKKLMTSSAEKGNLANAGMVLESGQEIAASESLVVTNIDATAHSERLLVEKVCKEKKQYRTPGLTMVSVCEPCLMCLSACAEAGYKEVAYILPAKKYIGKMPWVIDNVQVDKNLVAKTFLNPISLSHLSQYEEEFSKVFEELEKKHLA